MTVRLASILLLSISTLFCLAASASTAKPEKIQIAEFPANFPYQAFAVRDTLGRTVNFYLTDIDAKDDRPLIVVLQGSGCTSLFTLRGGKPAGGWFSWVRRAAKDKAQVLLIDKPGVKLFDASSNLGDASQCSPEFAREQTGTRWIEAIRAAVKAATQMRVTPAKAIMVLGHSEGAVFAPRVAAADPSLKVTHVASLAAAPISQLHSFIDMASQASGMFANAVPSSEGHLGGLLSTLAAIQSDSQSDTKTAYGHPYRYWTDKFAPVNLDSIAGSGAKHFIAYGDRDENSSPKSMDHYAAELVLRKADVTWVRVAGADHGFAVPSAIRENSGSLEGFQNIVERAVAWFLTGESTKEHRLWPR